MKCKSSWEMFPCFLLFSWQQNHQSYQSYACLWSTLVFNQILLDGIFYTILGWLAHRHWINIHTIFRLDWHLAEKSFLTVCISPRAHLQIFSLCSDGMWQQETNLNCFITKKLQVVGSVTWIPRNKIQHSNFVHLISYRCSCHCGHHMLLMWKVNFTFNTELTKRKTIKMYKEQIKQTNEHHGNLRGVTATLRPEYWSCWVPCYLGNLIKCVCSSYISTCSICFTSWVFHWGWCFEPEMDSAHGRHQTAVGHWNANPG